MLKKQMIIAWELGSGMGHTGRLRPLIDRFLASGLAVQCLAIREKDAARQLPCPVEEAPWLKSPPRDGISWIGHLADSLAALGWQKPDHLKKSVDRWREVLIAKRPDVLVMDSAPTAMLASLGLPIMTVWLANHWSTPPRTNQILDLQSRLTGKPRSIPDTEPSVVDAINACLVDQDQVPIAHLYELFDRADVTPMLTIPEIDPYGPRADTEYLGIWGRQPGAAPPWAPCKHGPDTPGIFAYLKPFSHRGATLKLLAETSLPIQAFTPKLSKAEADSIQGDSIQCFTSPIDWLVKQQSTAFIVCHGGAGMTGRAIQLGLPILSLPTSLEQMAVTMRASQTGACVGADIQNISSIGSALEQMFSDESLFEAAGALGKKYEQYNPEQAAMELADTLLALDTA